MEHGWTIDGISMEHANSTWVEYERNVHAYEGIWVEYGWSTDGLSMKYEWNEMVYG